MTQRLKPFARSGTQHHIISIKEKAMDTSSILSTLLSASSIKGISKTTGTDTDTVTTILSQAVPALLTGANKQATNSKTAESFAQALTEHAQDNTSNVGTFLKNVDLNDGAKIIQHLLGSSTASTTKSISKAANTDAETTSSVLSAAAPLLMSLLGKSAGSNTSSDALSSLIGGLMKNVSVTDLLGGLLGSSSTSKKTTKKSTSSAASSIAGSLIKNLLK